jgi:hypothetical protein
VSPTPRRARAAAAAVVAAAAAATAAPRPAHPPASADVAREIEVDIPNRVSAAPARVRQTACRAAPRPSACPRARARFRPRQYPPVKISAPPPGVRVETLGVRSERSKFESERSASESRASSPNLRRPRRGRARAPGFDFAQPALSEVEGAEGGERPPQGGWGAGAACGELVEP